MSAPPLHQMTTSRLVLRPSTAVDAARAFEIQSDWEVTRMLSMASFPPDLQALNEWFSDHPRQWAAGEAYRFAIEHEERFIGLVDIDDVHDGRGTLGYWLDRAAWGQGFALEAATMGIRFAFDDAGLQQLRAGHAADNHASKNILLKLGFRPVEAVERMSRPRGEFIRQHRYVLTATPGS